MKQFVALILLILPLTLTVAQTDDELWYDYMERLAEKNNQESIDDELMEQLATLREWPINLNDTTSTALQELPFINPLQVAMLRAYILQYGPVLSWSELSLIRGFDSTTIRLLKPIAQLSPTESREQLNLKKALQDGRSNMIVGGKRTLEPIEGYEDGTYPGSPYRCYFRYQFKYKDQLTFQFSGDKDPGEQFFCGNQKQGFDYYGYYLQVKDVGRLRNAIIGKYQLQWGQGLTLWSGFAPWNVDGSSVWRYGQGIRPSSAFCEYGYLQGAAATVTIGRHTNLTTFYSYVRHDATDADSGQVVQGITLSGYHRTQNECERKDNLGEHLLGANVQYQYHNLSMGMTAYHSMYDKSIVPKDYIYNSFAFAGKRNTCLGAYYAYRIRKMVLFGEAALSSGRYKDYGESDKMLPLALMTGFQYQIDSRNKLSGYYRYYAPSYQNLHASPLGASSNGQNEEGLCINLQSELPYHTTGYFSIDMYRHPWMRYRVYAPSTGTECRVRLEKMMAPNCKAAMQYRGIEGERNGEGESYRTEKTTRHQLYCHLDYSPEEIWQLSTRISYTWSKAGAEDWERGFLAYQNISYRPQKSRVPVSIDCRYTIFNISDYDARIYAYENDLMYEYSTPSFQGQGYRVSAMLRYELSGQLTIGAKYCLTQYVDRESIGSGNDKINRSHKQEIKLQLRYVF